MDRRLVEFAGSQLSLPVSIFSPPAGKWRDMIFMIVQLMHLIHLPVAQHAHEGPIHKLLAIDAVPGPWCKLWVCGQEANHGESFAAERASTCSERPLGACCPFLL